MLPPPEIMEQKLAAQHVEMQRLSTENQRTAAIHGTLRQELVAAQHELQILHAQIEAVTSEREQQMKSLTDKIAKMEVKLQAAEPVKIHNFIRKHVGRNDADFMEYEDINWAYENIIDSENAHGQESDDDDDDNDDGDDDGESNNSSGFEMKLTRDAIASSLINLL